METNLITHVAFADETHYNTGRYRAIAVISMPIEYLEASRAQLRSLLKESNILEFKWKNLTSARARFAATKMLNWTVQAACSNELRVDVLIWDIQDQRHNIAHRDDIENMHRLFYRLCHNMMACRWPSEAWWALYPDEHTAMKWHRIEYFLKKNSTKLDIRDRSLIDDDLSIELRQEFRIGVMQSCNSHHEPMVQLADLCAGLAVYSWDSFDKYKQWQEDNSLQQSLFKSTPSYKISNSDKERCPVLHEFHQTCKKRKLQVSLNSSRGLKTHKPANPINFWLYTPQHDGDKAPVKGDMYDGQ